VPFFSERLFPVIFIFYLSFLVFFNKLDKAVTIKGIFLSLSWPFLIFMFSPSFLFLYLSFSVPFASSFIEFSFLSLITNLFAFLPPLRLVF